MDVTPRSRICLPPPGAPEFAWIDAPTAFPCTAGSAVCDDTGDTSSPLTVATALARLRRSTAVACPVTTTSDNRSGSRVSAAASTLCPAGSGKSAKLCPIRRIETTTLPCGTLPRVKVPVALVIVVSEVPRTDTLRALSQGGIGTAGFDQKPRAKREALAKARRPYSAAALRAEGGIGTAGFEPATP